MRGWGDAVSACNQYVYARTDVIDGDVYGAICPACRWESDPATNYTVARARADAHRNRQGENQ